MWCDIQDKIKASIGDWNMKVIFLYLGIIVLFIILAYQVYYKYILPRLNPDFLPNKEFETSGETDGADGKKTKKIDTAELIFFCVKWSPHCKKAKPEWEKVMKKFEDQKINGVTIYFKEIDCEVDEELANEYKVDSYPTIKLIKGDQVIEYNAKPEADILEEFLFTTL